MRPKLLVSLHDVTPFHLDRIARAEDMFRELGVAKAAYLFVPQYHGGYPSDRHPGFAEWCRAPRAFGVEWFLHGFNHLETAGAPATPDGASPPADRGLADAWKRRLLTAGEGEFLALDERSQRELLRSGLASFRHCLGSDPAGFIAPAWLFNGHLLRLLKEFSLPYTEDHRRVYHAATGKSLRSPVITWATRTVLRKYGSLVVCPLLARMWSAQPILRVAVHPFDFDHPETARNIRKVLRRLLAARDQSHSGELDFG